MHVGTADRGFVDLYKDIGQADFRLGDLLEPETGFCLFLYKSLHA
jgi:hypothetical protein